MRETRGAEWPVLGPPWHLRQALTLTEVGEASALHLFTSGANRDGSAYLAAPARASKSIAQT
jgi:hypothetical protein